MARKVELYIPERIDPKARRRLEARLSKLERPYGEVVKGLPGEPLTQKLLDPLWGVRAVAREAGVEHLLEWNPKTREVTLAGRRVPYTVLYQGRTYAPVQVLLELVAKAKGTKPPPISRWPDLLQGVGRPFAALLDLPGALHLPGAAEPGTFSHKLEEFTRRQGRADDLAGGIARFAGEGLAYLPLGGGVWKQLSNLESLLAGRLGWGYRLPQAGRMVPRFALPEAVKGTLEGAALWGGTVAPEEVRPLDLLLFTLTGPLAVAGQVRRLLKQPTPPR
jgi:hypothetical protein